MRRVLLLLAIGFASPLSAAERSLTIDDYFHIGEVSDPRMSPDGAWVAHVVTTRDREKDETKRRIWMIPSGGGDAVPMTEEETSASHPRWSPDGRYLAFLSQRGEDEKTQVWALFREGGDAVALTDVAQGVESFVWSPDGKRLALVLKDPRPEDLEEEEENEESEDEAPPPWVVDRQQFKVDYVGYLDRRRDHIYVLDLDAKRLTQITSGDYDDSEPTWSPDGKLIAFVSNRTEDPDTNYNTDIWIVPADNVDHGATLRRVTTGPGPDRSPAWSPDGRSLVYVSAPDTGALVYATNHLAVVPAEGGEPRYPIRALDRNAIAPRFSPDGKSIEFILEDSGEQILARIPVDGGEPERLIEERHVVEAFDRVEGAPLVALVSTPDRPSEVFLYEGRLKRLTAVNEALFSEIRLGEVEEIQFRSPDGTPLEGFVVKPPGFDASLRYPALLRIHGGPVSQYDYRFHFEAQLFAANGYVVVLPNPRGSSGYGQEFSLGIWQAWGEPDYEDVMASVDHVISLGYVDPERLGVGGWSYGGMLTNHVITRTDRFKAAITGASATLYVANYGHDQYQRWWEGELGLPWRNRELWDKLSPFNRVEEISTPTLIVGGEKDWNVPIINSEQLYIALKRLGVETLLVVYPGEFHSIRRPSYRQDLYERYLDWYGRYVKGVVPTN